MSKYYKIILILSAVFAYFPAKSMAQESTELNNVILEMQADMASESSDSVVINPIEEAAPTPNPNTAPPAPGPMPQPGIAAQPQSDLEAPVPVDVPAASEVLVESAPEPQAIPHSGLYYDPDSLGANNPFGMNVPRQVDPKYEPGSRFVVVEKGAGAGSTQAQLIAAQRALKLQRYASALDLFENLYKKTPNSRPVLMGLAIAQQKNGFTESAIATYEELLELDPGNTDATVNMLGLMKKRYPAVAYRRLKELWEDNAENPAIAAQLGLTSAATGNTRDAIRFLGIAASLEPNNASHFYNMAVLSDRAGATRDAIQLYQRALEVDITHGGGKTVPREEIYDRLAFLRRL
jgi:Flp pilus assembly protein TadD